MKYKIECQCCLTGAIELNMSQVKWFCSDGCRSQFSKSINSLLDPKDETSHILRARLSEYLNEGVFQVAERLFIEQTFQKLEGALYAQLKPISAVDFVSNWPEISKEEIMKLSDNRRDRISGALKARGFNSSYLWR